MTKTNKEEIKEDEELILTRIGNSKVSYDQHGRIWTEEEEQK